MVVICWDGSADGRPNPLAHGIERTIVATCYRPHWGMLSFPLAAGEALPAGLLLDPISGKISDTPTMAAGA